MAIIYLHGFASSGNSPKVDLIRSYFKNEKVFAPDLHPDPLTVIAQVTEIIASIPADERIVLVGTSMGGFYSWYLGMTFDIPAIIVNPAIEPHIITKQWLGENTNMATGEKFQWTQDYIDHLEFQYENLINDTNLDKIQVVVAMDDDLISSVETVEHFIGKTANITMFETGGHRFDRFERILPMIEKAA